MNIKYKTINKKEIDLIKPLWVELKCHHGKLSTHFPERYEEIKFSERKEEILKKELLKIDIVKDEDAEKIIGYCISSISEDNVGEIDSIYLVKNYRLSGIGDTLMKRSLNWMDKKGVKSKKIRIAVGNDELLSFYQKFDFLPRHIILEQK